MNAFVSAMNSGRNMGVTENGAVAHKTTANKLLDVFFAAGASRNDPDRVVRMLSPHMLENDVLARKLAFWTRDCRGGAGEREVFRRIMKANPDVFFDQFQLVPFYGRWDDLLELMTYQKSDEKQYQIAAYYMAAVLNGDGLAGKWAPRKGIVAARIQKLLNLTPKMYRKAIVAATNVVETQMCANQWADINFSHVPSLAAARYQKAFNKNDMSGKYAAYKEALESGKAKINAKAIFPHDVLKGSDAKVVEAQWKALPDYIGSDMRLLPICDVSGSMGGLPMEVSVALGLYIAERNKSAFKDKVMTFSKNPQWFNLSGDVVSRKRDLLRAPWGMNTDFENAYMLILKTAIANQVAQEDMPTHLIVLSDMQFDQAGGNTLHLTNIKNRFTAAGYEVPKIIFWNLRAVANSAPAQADDNGVALVSGFSPAILKSILACGEFDPVNVMMEALNAERYAQVQ